uniref:Dihydroxyacetone phosphate acyltransferase n=1 Tax=Phallusia mammillata TaxID=59560 RepID=A0A6F9DEJ8_9ASCI|nr:dihydroxyacetone phosphate acyltransferase [Phallusia mammillata]
MELLYGSQGSQKTQSGYINMLNNSKQQNFSTLRFATKDFKPPKYMHCHDRHTTKIWQTAMESDRVQWIIQQVVREESKSEEDVKQEAEHILKELAFTDHMTILRMLGYVLFKVLHSIYHDGVFINIETVKKLKDMIKHHPVVFMPSHRSYMDFTILSVVCFYLDLPLPAIAAGMDFMGMKVMGSVLRACGAFYMRRSFGTDRLYWALFTEYVHTILINGDRPMEFFIEGTRSRCGKSLNPKFGLLSVIAEPYLKAQTYDVLLIPISISYDRLLEEGLYGYELLGIPKPKESTSGLVKASSILRDNYGSVHVNFCDHISLRKYFGHLDRAVHACYPRYMLRLSSEEQKYMEILGYKIVLQQQHNMNYTPWAVMALVLSQHPHGMDMGCLIEETIWLKIIMDKCKIKVNWSTGSVQDIVQANLKKFKHLIEVEGPCNDVPKSIVRVSGITHEVKGHKTFSSNLDPTTIQETVNHIIIGNYRNQLLHHFVRPSLIAFSLLRRSGRSCPGTQFNPDTLLPDFKFLRDLLVREFIFEPKKLNDDLKQGLQFLVQCNAVVLEGFNSFILEKQANKLLQFLKSIFSVFLGGYWLTIQFLLNSTETHLQPTLPGKVQKWIAGILRNPGVEHEMLSLHMISNALHALVGLGYLSVYRVDNQKIVQPIQDQLVGAASKIAQFIDIPYLDGTQATKLGSTAAKL